MKHTITTAQAAERLSVQPAKVRKLIQEGQLPATKQGQRYRIYQTDLKNYTKHRRKKEAQSKDQNCINTTLMKKQNNSSGKPNKVAVKNGIIYCGDALQILPTIDSGIAQMIVADPPYFQVLQKEKWDNTWRSADDYLDWTMQWARECKRILRTDGLLYIFGQLGKREHVWLHSCSLLTREMQFHDMIIWDRVVGYNERYDSFTPKYEMILVLRKSANSKPYFNKDAVRIHYEENKIQSYLKDKRYKNKEARERHLRKGKYATNILRVPSLKGSSKEKVGHPSQKPILLIKQLVRSSSQKGDLIVDPFLGSGTTAEAAERNGCRWIGIEKERKYAELSQTRIQDQAIQPEINIG